MLKFSGVVFENEPLDPHCESDYPNFEHFLPLSPPAPLSLGPSAQSVWTVACICLLERFFRGGCSGMPNAYQHSIHSCRSIWGKLVQCLWNKLLILHAPPRTASHGIKFPSTMGSPA